MSWLSILGTPFKALIDGVAAFFNKRQEIAAKSEERADELKLAMHKASVERVERGDVTESDYDMEVLRNSKTTIIDEVMIMWVLAVVTCLFVPTLAPYAIAGFASLAGVPLWFQLVFVGCFIAKLGLRFLFSGRTLFGAKVK